MSFSERLKELRIKNYMTQEQLAEVLNVSRQSVSKYELGLVYPDVEKIIQISQLFRISTDYLLKGETADKLSGTAKDMWDVIEAVSAKTAVSISELLGRGRDERILLFRRVAMYIMKEQLGISCKDIAAFFGGRDITSVIMAVNVVLDRIAQRDSRVLELLN